MYNNNKAFAERETNYHHRDFFWKTAMNTYAKKKKHFTLRKRKTTCTRNTMHQISYFFK